MNRRASQPAAAGSWFRLPALAACFAVFGAACSGPSSFSRRPVWSGNTSPVPLTAAAVLAPPFGDIERELLDLERSPDASAALLRRGWLRLEQGRLDDAVQLSEAVLYSGRSPTPGEEALARFVRGTALERRGDPDRARFDLDEARRLAIDPDLRLRLGDAPHAASPSAGAAPGLGYRNRAAWSAAPARPGRLDPMGRIYRITVHHSAVPLRTNAEQAAQAAVRKIQMEHMNGRGYGDIGYHYLIDPAGRIWAGRDIKWQGAHARGDHNKGNIGICVLGSFIRGGNGQAPTAGQVQALAALVKLLEKEYQVSPDQLHTHREFVATECPGALLQSVVDRMRAPRTAVAH